MDEYFLKRYTSREYTDKDVSLTEINRMLEAAMHAPTTGNMQLYSVIVTKDKELLNGLYAAHFCQPAAIGSKTLITFCADYNRFEKWCIKNNAKPGYRNFQSFMSAVLDTVILAQQFVTIAEMEGYGCCYLGTTTYNADKISDILCLPDMVVPIVTLSIGFPVNATGNVSDRLDVNSIVHNDVYHDYGDDEIDHYYKYKDELEDNIRFIKENGKQTLAQVFTDVRYTKIDNEKFSKVYFDLISRKGFKFPE